MILWPTSTPSTTWTRSSRGRREGAREREIDHHRPEREGHHDDPRVQFVKGVGNIVELHSVETQTEELSMHGLRKLFENVVDEDVMALSAASGISVVTESGEAIPPADDGRRVETQEEFEIVDDDDQIIVNDEHIIVQEDIIVQGEIIDPEIETFA